MYILKKIMEGSMPNITQEFIEYLFDKALQITDCIKEKAKACRLDYMAVATAGAKKNRKHWESLLQIIPSGNALLIGYQEKVDSKTAAIINGFNAHALELDDGHRFAMIHLGAPIISAITAAVSENDIREDDFLTGIIMGYEAASRLAIAMQPSHKNRGYHASGTCAMIGAAVGVAFALEMNKEQMNRVISCAAGSAAGMLEMIRQKSELKPYNVGCAAMNGLVAAYMGFTGYKTPDDMLGGDGGFFRTFSDNFDTANLTNCSDYFEIERIYVKPYASCRHTHSAVEAAIKLHDGLNCAEIESVLVETYKLGIKGHDHTTIQGIASAKMSTPYAVAAALLYGRADLSVFEPLNEDAIALAKKVLVIENVELTAEIPQKRIAIVTVKLSGGTENVCRVDYAKGEPENPLTNLELEEKIKMLHLYTPNY